MVVHPTSVLWTYNSFPYFRTFSNATSSRSGLKVCHGDTVCLEA